MSLYLGVVRKVEALRDPASVLFDLHAELEAARAAYQEQCRRTPGALLPDGAGPSASASCAPRRLTSGICERCKPAERGSLRRWPRQSRR